MTFLAAIALVLVIEGLVLALRKHSACTAAMRP
jgi:uncharacterized protein YjeT (DUF2065 family)